MDQPQLIEADVEFNVIDTNFTLDLELTDL